MTRASCSCSTDILVVPVYCANICLPVSITGPTIDYGEPASTADPTKFAAYPAAIDDVVADVTLRSTRSVGRRYMRTTTYPVSAVLVDGRFRVACALRALRYVRPGYGVVMVHDWDRQEYRKGLFPFFEEVEVAGRLAVLTPRHNVDWDAWRAAVDAFEKVTA